MSQSQVFFAYLTLALCSVSDTVSLVTNMRARSWPPRRPHSARLSSACSRSAAAELRRQACPPRGHGGRHSPSPAPSVAQRRHGKDAAAEAREGRRRRGWGGREREVSNVFSHAHALWVLVEELLRGCGVYIVHEERVFGGYLCSEVFRHGVSHASQSYESPCRLQTVGA